MIHAPSPYVVSNVRKTRKNYTIFPIPYLYVRVQTAPNLNNNKTRKLKKHYCSLDRQTNKVIARIKCGHKQKKSFS